MNTRRRGRTFYIGLLALIIVFGSVGVGFFAAPATAGDQYAVIQFEPRESTVEPGETIEVDVTLQSDGHPDAGVYKIDMQVTYASQYVTVTDIDRGPWLESAPLYQDGDAEIRTEIEIDDSAGVAELTQEIRPHEDGTTGADTIATLTIEIADDAPPSTVSLQAGNSEAHLTDQWPQPIVSQNGQLIIDGGGEGTPADESETSTDSNGAEEHDSDTQQGDEAESVDEDERTEETDQTESEIPVPLALAIATGMLLLLRYSWRST